MYRLVVTDDFSRFSWVFFLASKDENSEILKPFITGIENLKDLRVKVIRCENRTEFKNRVMNQFCEIKGIKREFSVARTLQQNKVAERKNKTLIDAARTMLADTKLPITFWAEAVNIMSKIGYNQGKFDRKADEGFFIRYSTNSKAFRVFNSRTRIVEENMHVKFKWRQYLTKIVGNKMHKAFSLPVIEFPVAKEVPTASEESCHCQKKKEATAVKIALLLKSRRNCQSKSDDNYVNKYKTAQELWAAILKTFGGNEATKKTKKNLLKQQYGNIKAEGIETLEQTFNRLQVIISQLQFMDVDIKQDDLNQKFLTSLAPEWLMHTIVWRNVSDLDTMSLDDLYNHLNVYESEV
nr:hypothetical protein [Tanacetum cinerariifolium]